MKKISLINTLKKTFKTNKTIKKKKLAKPNIKIKKVKNINKPKKSKA